MNLEEIKTEKDEHFSNLGKIQDRQYLLMEEARQDVCRCTNPEEMVSIFQLYARRFSDCDKYYDNEVNEWMRYYKEYETMLDSILCQAI